MLPLINNMMSCCFKTSNFTHAKSLLRLIDQFPEFKRDAKISDRVTYSYYHGRRSFFDGDLKSAATELTFAFDHCLATSTRNKRLFLIYLVPLKLLSGQVPSEELLMKYNLPQYVQITRAVKQGNIKLLNEAINNEKLTFIQWGVFLVLERLRSVTYRTLFKKVFAHDTK